MTKETLTLIGIKCDLGRVVDRQMSDKTNLRIAHIVLYTPLAVLLGMLLQNLYIALIIFLIPIFHIVLYIRDLIAHKTKKKAVMKLIERGEISISEEIFSHIANEMIHEPNAVGTEIRSANIITRYWFASGSSWRIPHVSKHYGWSKDFHITSKGLENISIKGDAFYLVALQEYPDISYIYPCKHFALDGSLHVQ